MSETPKKKTTRKPRPRPTSAIAFTVWPANGSTLNDEIVAEYEAAFQSVSVALFNKGYRLLTQTTRG